MQVATGGARVLIDHLLRTLPVKAGSDSLHVFRPATGDRLPREAEEVVLPTIHPFLYENILLPLYLRRHPVDVLICPKNLVPPFLPAHVASVAVVLDLAYFPAAGAGVREYKLCDALYMRAFMRASARRATHVVAISKHTRQDLIKLFALAPKRISVAYPGVASPKPETISPDAVTNVKHALGLHRPYIFYAGSLSPRKNAIRLLHAFAELKDQMPHDLVVTAGKSWKDKAVEREMAQLQLADRFHRLGTVTEDQLHALYRGAALSVYPSLYEGFGLPVLEAMACGCPVVASNRSAVPEAVGDAAVLVNPLQEADIKRGMLEVLQSEARREQLRKAGRQHAAKFRWESFGDKVYAAAEQAFHSKRS